MSKRWMTIILVGLALAIPITMAVAQGPPGRDGQRPGMGRMVYGVITGIATINRDFFGKDRSQTAVVIYDYSVLAGTQGFFHHKKLDRIFKLARDLNIPVIMYSEGGGGRPGDAASIERGRTSELRRRGEDLPGSHQGGDSRQGRFRSAEGDFGVHRPPRRRSRGQPFPAPGAAQPQGYRARD